MRRESTFDICSQEKKINVMLLFPYITNAKPYLILGNVYETWPSSLWYVSVGYFGGRPYTNPAMVLPVANYEKGLCVQ